MKPSAINAVPVFVPDRKNMLNALKLKGKGLFLDRLVDFN